MANYYFLATLLPTLKVGGTPEIGSRELNFLLRHNLSEADLSQVTAIRRFVDLQNIQSIWRKEPIRMDGNLNEVELEECLLFKQGLPSYVIEFLQEYKDTAQRLQHFPKLLHRFFEVETAEANGFLADYFRFEWQWRLAFVSIRAQALGRDLASELKYEDPENPFVAQLPELPEPYIELKSIFELNRHSPLDLHQLLLEWRFNQIEKHIEWETVSIARILGYITQLDIVQQWLKLDKRKGMDTVKQIIEQSKVGDT